MGEYLRQFFIAVLSFLLLIFVGTLGYHLIEGWSVFEAFYMTIITLSTVGFGEIHPLSESGRLFTMFLILGGVGVAIYVFSMVTEAVVSGQLQELLGRRRLEHKIEALKGHYIICGYGRIGRHICRIIAKEVPFVIIENDPEAIKEIEKEGFIYVEGDATHEDVLKKAGIERAKGLVGVLRSDADNVYVTLTARSLNPNLFIIVRADEEMVVRKLERAGADKVISPYLIGARRMALTILRPAVTDFLEVATPETSLELQLEEVSIRANSDLVGKKLIESGIRQFSGAIILAVRKVTGEMIFNPPPEYILEEDDTLVALGDRKGLGRLENVAAGTQRLSEFS